MNRLQKLAHLQEVVLCSRLLKLASLNFELQKNTYYDFIKLENIK